MTNYKRLTSKVTIFGLLVVLNLKNIIEVIGQDTFIHNLTTVSSVVFFLLILSSFLESYIYDNNLMSLGDFKWMNPSKSLKRMTSFIKITTMISLMVGLYALMVQEYYLLGSLCILVMNLHLLFFNNSKIIMGNHILMVRGLALHLESIDAFDIEVKNYINLTIRTGKAKSTFRFKIDAENQEALAKVKACIEK